MELNRQGFGNKKITMQVSLKVDTIHLLVFAHYMLTVKKIFKMTNEQKNCVNGKQLSSKLY